MSRAVAQQLTLVDWVLTQQGVRLEPVLAAISNFLDAHCELIAQVQRDLERGLKNPRTGRGGLTAEQVLRSLVLMRVKNWHYRELRERIADGFTLRQFTAFYARRVPRHDAFQRGFNRLTPQTLKVINELVVRAAVELGLEDGRKLRVDTTVVETDVHHPTDNTLLWDAVRIVTRLVNRLATALGGRHLKDFRNRTRVARRRMQDIQRMTTWQRQERQNGAYRQLIGIAEEVVSGARKVLQQTAARHGKDAIAGILADELRKQIKYFCDLGDRVIDQARRRVLDGEAVPNSEKIYSIFEPHTDLIKRGKVRSPIEFGHKVFLAESAHGLITQYEVLTGNPGDEHQVVASLQRHRDTFGRAPELYGADRGFYSERSVASCAQDGVKIASIPQRGGRKTSERAAHEKSADFKQGQRFRAGVEGRILGDNEYAHVAAIARPFARRRSWPAFLGDVRGLAEGTIHCRRRSR